MSSTPKAEPEQKGDGGGRGRLPDIPWSAADAGWGTLGGLILGGLIAPALILPFDPTLETDAGLLAAQALLGISLLGVAIGAASGWTFKSLREALSRLGLRRFAPSALGWMVLAMVAYYIAAGLFASLVVEPEQDDIADELGTCDPHVLVAVVAVGLIAILAPLSEELFFRGFVFSGIRSRFSFWPAALIAGLVFGMIHAPTGILTVIPLGVLGVALCWLYEKTGSLWPCVIAHAINNCVALAVVGC